MNIDSTFPSNYIKSDELNGDTVFTISKVVTETLGQGKDAEIKPIIYFQGAEKGLVLNKTNATVISGLYGKETDNWVGKQITLFATEVQFGAEMVLGIRVRMRKPAAAGAIPQQPAAQSLAQASDVQTKAARKEVWDTFKSFHPGKTETEILPDWRKLLAAVVPGKDPRTFNIVEWDLVGKALMADGQGNDVPVEAAATDEVPW